MSSLLPCRWPLIASALEGWVGPVVYEHSVALWDGTRNRLHGYEPDGELFVSALTEAGALDLDRPEVQDRLYRIIQPWGLEMDASDWSALLENWHADILHLAHKHAIATALGLDPQPGDALTWRRDDDDWVLVVGDLTLIFTADTGAVSPSVVFVGALEDPIADPQEAARVVAEEVCP